jgi:hypothetical protein
VVTDQRKLPMKIFDDLDHAAQSTLRARLHNLIATLDLTEEQDVEFKSALAAHGIDELDTLERISLAAVAALLKGRLEELPVAALLVTMLNTSDPLAEDYDRLVGWTVFAALTLDIRDPKHGSKIDAALASVRLMRRRKERMVLELFSGKTATAFDIATTANAHRGLVADLGQTIDRCADIHVLLHAYLERKAPKTLQRSEQDDLYYVTEIVPASDIDLDDDIESTDLVHTVALLHQNGDPINPEHSAPRVVALVSPFGTAKDQSVAAYQQHRADIAVQAILRRRMALPCHYGALTNHEIGIVLKAFVDDHSPEWRERLLIVLTLLTGRAPDVLIDLPRSVSARHNEEKLWWEQTRDGITLCYDPGLTKRRFSADASLVLEERPFKPLKLALPNELARPLKRLFDQIDRGEAGMLKIDPVFQAIWPQGHRRVTLRRVAGVIRDRVIQGGHDGSIAAYIHGESPQNVPALYYVAHDNVTVGAIFRKTVNALPGACFTWPSDASHRVGSSLQPMVVMIAAFYGEAAAHLLRMQRFTLRDRLRFHNLYAALVCTSLNLMTGHRPVRRPFETLDDFDLRNRLLYISDKELRVVNAGRFVPLAKCTVAQIEEWTDHLASLAPLIGHVGGDIVGAIQRARDGMGPLFFFLDLIDDRQIRFEPVAPKRLDHELAQIWPLPLNWGRHVQRTLLPDIHGDLADAFMGHADPGAEALGPQSGLSIADLSELRDALDHVAHGLRVQVFKGLA